MRKTLLLIIASICVFSVSNAQSIAGKWKCPKEFLDGLGLLYQNMSGQYKFKKNGTFEVKINGSKAITKQGVVMRNGGRPLKIHSEHRQMYIKVTGTYDVINDSISTTVDPKDVYCYIEPGRKHPEAPDADESEYATRGKEMEQRRYDEAVFQANVQAQTVKEELMPVWIWNKEPITISKNLLVVGDKIRLKKK